MVIREEPNENIEFLVLEAESSCDGTLEDLADELWRRYVDEKDAVKIIKDYYNFGLFGTKLMRNIRNTLRYETIEDVVHNVYYAGNSTYDMVSSHFGRV